MNVQNKKPTKFLLIPAFLVTALLSFVVLTAVPFRSTVFASGSPSSQIPLKAQKNDCNGPDITAGAKPNDKNHCGIADVLKNGINILSATVGIVIVAMVIIGGIQYSTSGDDPQAVAKAKGKIINALLALVVFVFGYAFLQWVVPGGVLWGV